MMSFQEGLLSRLAFIESGDIIFSPYLFFWEPEKSFSGFFHVFWTFCGFFELTKQEVRSGAFVLEDENLFVIQRVFVPGTV